MEVGNKGTEEGQRLADSSKVGVKAKELDSDSASQTQKSIFPGAESPLGVEYYK